MLFTVSTEEIVHFDLTDIKIRYLVSEVVWDAVPRSFYSLSSRWLV